MHTFKERALHPFKRREYDVLRALNDVSFAVPHGEFFGIVGRNGSGKSTLLKCLAGIYGLDSGDIYVNGRVSTFIELGVGFNPDLAARDNATLNAIMLGLTRRDAEERYQRILDFSELHEFEDLKIKNYSSGMLVRLAFSVMIQVDADILLIDEVLAVGDASFQQKCYDEFARLRREGRTVVLVTHDMGAVERFCDRALLLEHGRPEMIGDPHKVGLRYLDLNFAREERDDAHEEEDRHGDGRAEILDAWFEDADGRRTGALPGGQRCSFVGRARFREEVEDPILGFALQNAGRQTVVAASTLALNPRLGTFHPGEELTIRIAFANVFRPD